MLCINLGHVAAAGVGLKPPKDYKSWFELEEAPKYVLYGGREWSLKVKIQSRKSISKSENSKLKVDF